MGAGNQGEKRAKFNNISSGALRALYKITSYQKNKIIIDKTELARDLLMIKI